jgi:hypothetical protein
MPLVDVTSPKVGDCTLVSTPEYCTVLKTLFAVALTSRLRVSPICSVFDNDIAFEIVPGPRIELREAFPMPFAGAVALNALVLNH